MIDQVTLTVIIAAGVLIIVLLFISFSQIRLSRRSHQDREGISENIQSLVQALKQEQIQSAKLSEKISQITPVPDAMNHLQIEIQAMNERIASVEKKQNMVHQGVGYLANNTLSNISELKTLTSGLSEATTAMRSELSNAKSDLSELQARSRAERLYEFQVKEAINRLEIILSGIQSKKISSIDYFETLFANLPAEWQVHDLEVAGKLINFGIRLPNGLILPVDNNLNNGNFLEQYLATKEDAEQLRIKKEIEGIIFKDARDLSELLGSEKINDYGIIIVPDLIFDLCFNVQSSVIKWNVVLVSYSMLVPYLLLVFQTELRSCTSIDLNKLDNYLQSTIENVNAIQDELDGRLAHSIELVGESRDEIRNQISSLLGRFENLQIGASSLEPDFHRAIPSTKDTERDNPPTTAMLT